MDVDGGIALTGIALVASLLWGHALCDTAEPISFWLANANLDFSENNFDGKLPYAHVNFIISLWFQYLSAFLLEEMMNLGNAYSGGSRIRVPGRAGLLPPAPFVRKDGGFMQDRDNDPPVVHPRGSNKCDEPVVVYPSDFFLDVSTLGARDVGCHPMGGNNNCKYNEPVGVYPSESLYDLPPSRETMIQYQPQPGEFKPNPAAKAWVPRGTVMKHSIQEEGDDLIEEDESLVVYPSDSLPDVPLPFGAEEAYCPKFPGHIFMGGSFPVPHLPAPYAQAPPDAFSTYGSCMVYDSHSDGQMYQQVQCQYTGRMHNQASKGKKAYKASAKFIDIDIVNYSPGMGGNISIETVSR